MFNKKFRIVLGFILCALSINPIFAVLSRMQANQLELEAQKAANEGDYNKVQANLEKLRQGGETAIVHALESSPVVERVLSKAPAAKKEKIVEKGAGAVPTEQDVVNKILHNYKEIIETLPRQKLTDASKFLVSLITKLKNKQQFPDFPDTWWAAAESKDLSPEEMNISNTMSTDALIKMYQRLVGLIANRLQQLPEQQMGKQAQVQIGGQVGGGQISPQLQVTLVKFNLALGDKIKAMQQAELQDLAKILSNLMADQQLNSFEQVTVNSLKNAAALEAGLNQTEQQIIDDLSDDIAKQQIYGPLLRKIEKLTGIKGIETISCIFTRI